MTRKREIVTIVTMLAEAMNKSVTPETFAIWEIGLAGIELAAIKRAVELWVKRSRFMPTPADIREMAGEIRPDDRAQQAWIIVERAVRRVGAYKTVSFDDIAINATLRSLGGWVRVCETEGVEFDTHLRREFMKTYASLCSSGVGQEHGAPLPGILDRENAKTGYPAQPPLKIITGLPAAAPAPLLTAPKVPTIDGPQ